VKRHYWTTSMVVVAVVTHSACERTAEPMTAEQIVASCAEAMGGEHGIESLRTLSFANRMATRPGSMLWEIDRPNLIRKEQPERLILAFDGHRAAFLQSPPNDDGTPAPPRMIVEEDWHHFEMDIALYVPAFFDYPVTSVDTTTVDGSPAHLLRVDLPMGGVAVYAVDAASFLPTKVILPDWDLERFLGGYRNVDGFTYFTRYWTGAGEADAVEMENLELNVALDASRFAIPESLTEPQ